MYKNVVCCLARNGAIAAVILFSFTLHAASSVSLAWDASPSTNIAGYTVRYGTTSGTYPLSHNAGTSLTTTISALTAGTRYSFVVTARNSSGLESDPSNEISYTPPVATVTNVLPTLNAISNLTIGEDATQQTISLTGITAGIGDLLQVLTVSASSSNPALIPTPIVTYTSPNTTGTLRLTPATNASGTATITVTVNDGQSLNNTISRTFTVTVNAVNDAPTLNSLGNLTLAPSAGPKTVALTGIGTGAANEIQALTVTAISSNPSLIPTPTISYSSPNATGSLSFTPTTGTTGTSTITVTVNDGQSLNNTVSRSFVVTVSGASTQTIYVEAETGARTSPMTIASDTRAANGQYAYSPTAKMGTLSIPFNISQAGNYWLWCRVLSPNSSRDSFFVRMDGGVEERYNTAPNSWSSEWQWTRVKISGSPRIYNLSQGAHTIVFRCREANTALDALYITSDPNFVPPSVASLAFTAASVMASSAGERALPAQNDSTAPVVSQLEVIRVDARTITLGCRTDKPALCHADYGIGLPLAQNSQVETNYSTEHMVSLTQLQPGTVYLVRVQSIDTAGNVSLTEIGKATTPTENTFAWAAEDGLLVHPLKIRGNARAIGGAYISSPEKGRGSALFPIQVEVTSDYVLWCRIWLPGRGTGSFRISVDGEDDVVLRAAGSASRSAWRWIRASENPFQLDAGPHQFTFNVMQAGMWLDELILSNDPEWVPED